MRPVTPSSYSRVGGTPRAAGVASPRRPDGAAGLPVKLHSGRLVAAPTAPLFSGAYEAPPPHRAAAPPYRAVLSGAYEPAVTLAGNWMSSSLSTDLAKLLRKPVR